VAPPGAIPTANRRSAYGAPAPRGAETGVRLLSVDLYFHA